MRAVTRLAGLTLIGVVMGQSANASEFTFSFEWGDIPNCASGYPGTVPNPIFLLKHVPDGAATIAFQMKDLDAYDYYHGGSKVTYAGNDRIEPGAFKYKSPCPPDGRHRYRWNAQVLDSGGNKIAKASAKRRYPE